MKKSYGKGIATCTGPESRGAARVDGVEALTGVRAGRVFSRERNLLRDVGAVGESGRLHPMRRYGEALGDPAWSQSPCTDGNTLPGNREIRRSRGAELASGLIGKSKDVRGEGTNTGSRTDPWRGSWATKILTPTVLNWWRPAVPLRLWILPHWRETCHRCQ